MLMQKEREWIVHYGKKLITSGLTKGTGGNISVFDRENSLMSISPSAMDYFRIEPLDIVVMDLAGNLVEGSRKPSVEHAMHGIFYQNRKDVNAVVHTHSTACSVMAALGWELPAANYLVALAGGDRVPCAEYATFATEDLARAALSAMGTGYACFLANHGFLSAAPDVATAFHIAEEMEHCAEIYLRAKACGEPVILDEAEMMRIRNRLGAYGQGK